MVKRNLYSDILMSGGFGFNVFTEDEIDKIHLATLEVLEKTGLYVGAEEALNILEGGGAKVDRKRKLRSSQRTWLRNAFVRRRLKSSCMGATPSTILC